MKYTVKYQNGTLDPNKTWQDFATLTGSLTQIKKWLRNFHGADNYKFTDGNGKSVIWQNRP